MKKDPKYYTDRDVVYGHVRGGLVFIPHSDALRLKAIRDAGDSAKTWGELRAMFPAGTYEEYLEAFSAMSFDDFRACESNLSFEKARGEYDSLPIGARLPEESDSFAIDEAPGIPWGAWPERPDEMMLDWVPEDIRESFGRLVVTKGGRRYVEFHGSLAEILRSFEQRGFLCAQDQDLVFRASDYLAADPDYIRTRSDLGDDEKDSLKRLRAEFEQPLTEEDIAESKAFAATLPEYVPLSNDPNRHQAIFLEPGAEPPFARAPTAGKRRKAK